MKRLKVLQIGKFYPPHQGGIETHLQDLCGELQKFADVTAVVASDDRTTTETVDRGAKILRVATLCRPVSTPICPGMVRAILAAKADIVHIHLPNPFALSAYLVSGHRGRLVATYHSDVVRQELLERAFRPILFRALDRCAALIAATQEYVDSSPVLSAYRDRCQVVPYGISFEQYQHWDAAEVARIRAQHGPRISIAVGRLVYYKGLEYLIQAMSKVRGRLLIVGDGPLRSRLERQVWAEGLSEKVAFLGQVRDLIPYYHAADLFVLASIARSEAFGIVQLEAMACGKPVVNTRLPSGVPFVSVDGITGITVPPANPEALAKAINLLLDDPARRMQYGNAARRRVQAEFNLELMTRRILQLYQRVMKFPNMSATSPEPLPADLDLNMRIEEGAPANSARLGEAD